MWRAFLDMELKVCAQLDARGTSSWRPHARAGGQE